MEDGREASASPAPAQEVSNWLEDRTQGMQPGIKVKTFVPVCKEQKDLKTERDERKPSSAFNRRTLLTKTSLLMEDHKEIGHGSNGLAGTAV
jgi:hypothetical protein